MASPDLKSDPFPQTWDWEKVREWFARRLEGRKLEEIQLLGARAALRSLPLLHTIHSMGRKSVEISDIKHLFASLRCYLILAGAAFVSHADIKRFHAAAAGAGANASDADAEYASIAASAVAVAVAADAAYAYASVAYGAHAMSGARGGAGFGGFLQSYLAAFEEDISALEGKAPKSVMASPLWPTLNEEIRQRYQPALMLRKSDLFGGIPFDFRPTIGLMADALRKLPGDFAVWIEWYQGILDGEKNGRYLFGLPTARALRLNVEIALIPEEFWQSPAAANAEIRRLVEVARGEGIEPPNRERVEHSERGAEPEPAKQSKPNRSRKKKASVESEFAALKNEIDLYIASLLEQIDQHVEAAQSELQKLTDMSARQPWRDEIDRLEALRATAAGLKELVSKLAEGKSSKAEAEEKLGAFSAGVVDWWSKRHVTVLNKGADHAMNATAFGVYSLVGVGVGSIVGTPVLGMLLGAGAHAGKGALAAVIKKFTGLGA